MSTSLLYHGFGIVGRLHRAWQVESLTPIGSTPETIPLTHTARVGEEDGEQRSWKSD
jgi:hypothetical protein